MWMMGKIGFILSEDGVSPVLINEKLKSGGYYG